MPEDLGDIVRRVRGDLTQEDFGDAIGISGAAVSLVENGRRGMSDDVAEELADAFNLSATDRAGLLVAARARRRDRPRSVNARLAALEAGQERIEALVQAIADEARERRDDR